MHGFASFGRIMDTQTIIRGKIDQQQTTIGRSCSWVVHRPAGDIQTDMGEQA
jgi:hypothetical protein